jgi:hypothetical protein
MIKKLGLLWGFLFLLGGILGLVLFLTGFFRLQCPCIKRNCPPAATPAGA